MEPSTLELIGYTQNHIAVYYDPVHSHAATHFKATPGLKALVQEVLAGIVTTGEYMWSETDMGREVGATDLVETDSTDEIVYAKRQGRSTYSRFTKSRRPQPSQIVTVALEPLDENTYLLKSAWIGPVGYSFPDSPDAVPESREYWANHALVWGEQAVQPGTETNRSPWA